ncbi:flagellar FlbD family protein [Cohnella lubricantis]|uniref:Flagellar FlbD family protein n=1 Tax=Cohnella lubricantis TaxID=2163172 RepID=A0A841TAR7_9BACL|nr:flagellar FlbD family protein [Cohnella lubricantis]MBB6676488.1 flagellar FlbD family protein [Cohnella lubricantis]MBP2117105.1 uncharacterized protein YlzI (FlbEa/FlbD family) [Cohnella lubricantis]
MIRFTKPDGNSFYVSAEAISATSHKFPGETRIYVGSTIDDCFVVTESPEEVVRKIMEYKRYRMVHQVAASELDSDEERSAFSGLLWLAGLEDTPDE